VIPSAPAFCGKREAATGSLDYNQISNLRAQRPNASQKEFNWCPLTPIFLQNRPFGKNVERLSHNGSDVFILYPEF